MKNEQLWAPWRLGYIVGARTIEPESLLSLPPGGDPKCFICQAVPGDRDEERLVVQHGPVSITILNRFPYNNGHLLVAPRRHVARMDMLDANEQLEISQTLTQMVALLEKTIRAEGFNVGLNLGRDAGAGLPGHLHWHIVPRWNGDTNFMPVLAGVRVIPQSLEALWELLTTALAAATKDA